jgi:MFS family permease
MATPDLESAGGIGFEAHRRRSIVFLCIAAAGVGFTMALQISMNANFSAEEMHLSGFQQGVLEAFRESCGIFALGILVLLSGLAESRIGAISLLFVGVGLGCYTIVPDFFWLIMASMVFSQGLHVWMPLPSSMALALAEPGRQGRLIGRIQAAAAAGSGLGLVGALVMHKLGVSIRPLYIPAGVAAVLAAGACLFIPRGIKSEKPRLVLRKRYGMYYLLNFLEGWRKQIFLAFSGFLLVKNFGVSLETMLIFWIITQGVGWFTSPAVGRLIDRVGERKVLIFYYTFMTLCFLGYATIHSKMLIYGVYLLDSAFFVFAMALTTYIGRIVPPEEKTLTLSMGVAFNHVASVAMPLLGGLLWKYAGYQWTFLIGAAAAAASIVAAWHVPSKINMAALAKAPADIAPTPLPGGEPD